MSAPPPTIIGPAERLHVADSAKIADGFFNLSHGEIFIGSDVVFAHQVMLLTGAHNYFKGDAERHLGGGWDDPEWPWPEGRSINVEHGVWIGSRAIIIAGPITIGENAVVAAGAVVVKDVEPWTMVGGNPARVLKRLRA